METQQECIYAFLDATGDDVDVARITQWELICGEWEEVGLDDVDLAQWMRRNR